MRLPSGSRGIRMAFDPTPHLKERGYVCGFLQVAVVVAFAWPSTHPAPKGARVRMRVLPRPLPLFPRSTVIDCFQIDGFDPDAR